MFNKSFLSSFAVKMSTPFSANSLIPALFSALFVVKQFKTSSLFVKTSDYDPL